MLIGAVSLLAGVASAQDSDGDGVPDARDVCPSTPMSATGVDPAAATTFCEVADLTSDVFLRSRLSRSALTPPPPSATTIAPPAGWHSRLSTATVGSDVLGFVANPQADGWVNFNGDFFVPGTPEEGWGFSVDGGTTAFNGGLVGDNASPAPSPAPAWSAIRWSAASAAAARSSGRARPTISRVNHTYSVLNEGLFILIEVVLTNEDTVDHVVTYFRNVDPDNQQPITSSFVTRNTIVSQADGTMAPPPLSPRRRTRPAAPTPPIWLSSPPTRTPASPTAASPTATPTTSGTAAGASTAPWARPTPPIRRSASRSARPSPPADRSASSTPTRWTP